MLDGRGVFNEARGQPVVVDVVVSFILAGCFLLFNCWMVDAAATPRPPFLHRAYDYRTSGSAERGED